MKKVQYDHQPPKLEAVGNGSYLYRWGIEKVSRKNEDGSSTDSWGCYEVIAWKKERREITTAVINALRGSADYEAKLINDFNAVVAGLLDASYKQPYLDYIQKRNKLKAEITNYFESL